MKRLVMAAALLAVAFGGSGAAFALCGIVTIGHMPWNASKIVADIQARMLERAFECIVEEVEILERPVLERLLDKPRPDVVVGVWLHDISEKGREAVIEGELVVLADLFVEGSREGWWIPEHLAGDAGVIPTIGDVMERFDLFVETGQEKGTFHNCPDGWACRVVNDNLFEAYGLGERFVNRPAESGEALQASIRRAGELELPWFGYYWAPNAILGEVPMRMIELNELDGAGYRCNGTEDCAEPHAGRYPAWRVLTIARRGFVDRFPGEAALLEEISIPEAEMNRLLALYESDLQTPETVVDSFMAVQEELWRSWVPEQAEAAEEEAAED